MNAFPQHRARRRFGQNFLVDSAIIEKIVRAVAPQADDNLVEIGPGRGALTGRLLSGCPSLQVIELDRDLVSLLRDRYADRPQLRIHQGDALKFDFANVAGAGGMRVVGNLPYNISTPLLFRLLSLGAKITDMHFMLQKEVVDRLAAVPGTRAFGRLGVMAQYYCQVDSLFTVPPVSFRPAPRVTSAVVRLRPHRQPPIAATDPAFLARLVNACFQQRRKTLANALKPLTGRDALAKVGLALDRRPETLSVAEFVQLSNQLGQSHDETAD